MTAPTPIITHNTTTMITAPGAPLLLLLLLRVGVPVLVFEVGIASGTDVFLVIAWM